MERKKLAKLSLSELSEGFLIKNFILADTTQTPPHHISFETPFSFDGVIFGICLRGQAVNKINFKEHTLTPNTIFTILPNQIIEPISKSDDFFAEILLFSIDFVSGLTLPKNFDITTNIAKYPCVEIGEEAMQNLIDFHSFIVKAYHRTDNRFREEIAKGLLQVLFTILASIYVDANVEIDTGIMSRNEEITEQFIKLLIEYHQKERNASFYADKLCITTKYLSGVLKKVTGKSINVLINHAVIIKAKQLLKSTNLTVLQISEEMNFPNPSFFGRFFKQYVGMTPLEYRESQPSSRGTTSAIYYPLCLHTFSHPPPTFSNRLG